MENIMFKATNKFSALRTIALGIMALPLLAACGTSLDVFGKKSDINTTTKFSSAEYGVKASKRITTSSKIKKGGGRSQVGKPYKIAGKWYTPKVDKNYDKTGVASWYGPNFHGRETANGEIFDQYAISAAHPTLPLPSYVRVTNLENNKSIVVRVNDRGPFSSRRIIDLSKRVADILGVINKGTARVRVRYVGKAPLEGDDTRMLMASINKPTSMERRGGGLFTQNRVQIASVAPIKKAPTPKVSTIKRSATSYTQAASGFFIANRSSINSTLSPTFNLPVLSQSLNINPNTMLTPLFYTKNSQAIDKNINEAFVAATAMATRSNALENWRNSMDIDARKINLELGVFSKKANIERIISAFALIGAVEQSEMKLRTKTATKLTLTYLKLGVTRKDAIEIARELGLRDIILYN